MTMPIMSEEWQAQNQKNKERWFLGRQDAIAFINHLFSCVEIYDDLIDKDVELSDKQINDCFRSLMFDLPLNPWFSENRMFYLPLINMSLNAFQDANEMAKSDEEHLRMLAFHIRNIGIEIHIATAFLVGGYVHMRNVSREIREFFAFEKFSEWELKNG